MQPNKLPSGVTETPQETLNRAKDMSAPAVVTADELTNPPAAINIPEPTPPPAPNVVSNYQSLNDTVTNTINQSREDVQARQNDINSILNDGTPTTSDFLGRELERFGTPDAFKDYRNTVDQLNQLNTQYDLQNVRIQGGNSLAQGGREVTQNDRERAVMTTGLAARAELLRGNIEMATGLARDAATAATADRTNQLNNLYNQLTAARDQVSVAEQRQFDVQIAQVQEEQARVKELKENIANAIATGVASSQELAQLSDPNLDDAAKTALAQDITARAAQQDRSLAVREAEASISASEASAAASRASAARAQTSVIDIGNGQKQLINTQTGEVIATFGEGEDPADSVYTEEQAYAEAENVNDIASLASADGLNSAVGPNALARWSIEDLGGAKEEFVGKVENMLKTLTLMTYAEAKAQGMTFGAMSNAEWQILGQAASEIAQWRVHEDGDTSKRVVGYDVSEKAMKDELDSLTQYAKRNFVLRGGDPAQVGVEVMNDGSYWVQNSDGSLTKVHQVSTVAQPQ